jgi:signal transduction histidine kinase
MDARHNRFMEGFSPGGCERVLSRLVYLDLPAGDYLFREGEASDGVYLILEGAVEVIKNAGHREQIIACFEADDYLGEVTILDGQGRTTDARARGAVSLALSPTSDLLDVLATEPVSVTVTLFQRVMSHLRCVNEAYMWEVVHKEKLTLIGEMAGTLMHDLRNPVQVILSSADMIRMIHPDPQTVTNCERVRIQCDRLVTMADELLEFSKGEAKLHLERTNTGAFLDQFQKQNEDYFQGAGLKFMLEDESADIEVDSARLLRALQNLVYNSVEAVGKRTDGFVNVRVWVSDSVLHISVRDNGRGIPSEIQGHIFDPFVTQGKQGGIGLGMAIVRNVIEAHRGTITFETDPTGTEFVAKLPQDSTSPSVG